MGISLNTRKLLILAFFACCTCETWLIGMDNRLRGYEAPCGPSRRRPRASAAARGRASGCAPKHRDRARESQLLHTCVDIGRQA
eukprot:s5254_g2.t1